MARAMTVVQHVVIDVVKHADVERLKEPMCPEPDVCALFVIIYNSAHNVQVHILLPALAKLRTVVERLRPLANDGVIFRANHNGELQLAVTTDNARVEVGWSGLTNPTMGRFRGCQMAP